MATSVVKSYDSLIQHAMGADVMVSDALNHKMSQMLADATEDLDNNASAVTEDIQESHIRPEEAALVAREAGVPVLIITHVLPPVPDLLINPFLRDAREILNGEVRMANAGTLISQPVNSDRFLAAHPDANPGLHQRNAGARHPSIHGC